MADSRALEVRREVLAARGFQETVTESVHPLLSAPDASRRISSPVQVLRSQPRAEDWVRVLLTLTAILLGSVLVWSKWMIRF